jgi:hypothetical protein
MEFSYKVKLYHDNTLIYTEHFTEEDFYNNLDSYRCIEVPLTLTHARVDTGHLELWYGIVHVRTFFGYNDGFKGKWNFDNIVFHSDSESDHAFNSKPRFLSYYSFRLDTSLIHYVGTKKAKLMMGISDLYMSLGGQIGDLSYGIPVKKERSQWFRYGSSTHICINDLIAIFKIESGFCPPQEIIRECVCLTYTYRPGFFYVFFQCVMKLRRMSRKAQDTFRNTIQQVFHKHKIYGNYDIIQSILCHRFD